MPRNFDSPLTINDHGCITPAGPLDLAEGETPKRLDVWVWQEGGACAAVQRVFAPGSNRWAANPDPDEDHTGAKFVAGPATAMALLVSETKEGTKTFQWTEAILLTSDGGSPASPDHTH